MTALYNYNSKICNSYKIQCEYIIQPFKEQTYIFLLYCSFSYCCFSSSSCSITLCSASVTSSTTWGWRTLVYLWASPSHSPANRPAWTLWVHNCSFLSEILHWKTVNFSWQNMRPRIDFFRALSRQRNAHILFLIWKLYVCVCRESLWHGPKASRQQTVKEKMWWDCWGKPLRGER